MRPDSNKWTILAIVSAGMVALALLALITAIVRTSDQAATPGPSNGLQCPTVADTSPYAQGWAFACQHAASGAAGTGDPAMASALCLTAWGSGPPGVDPDGIDQWLAGCQAGMMHFYATPGN